MTLLILGGTVEGRDLAEKLSGLKGARVSLAGATTKPAPLALPVRRGGFGSAEGFADYLKTEKITAVIDATHPFAVRISARSRAVCDRVSVAYRQILRPSWQPDAEDNWRLVPDDAAAIATIPNAARVFLAIGRQRIDAFAGLQAQQVVIRMIDPPKEPLPIPKAKLVLGLPARTWQEEAQLFEREGIEWVVTKNSGGEAGRAKLLAARRLGLIVVMIDRPAPPGDRVFESVNEALTWLNQGSPA
ncbi:MAG: cobalt-precorrin-6A reductase [Pseudomonadota bacterium]